MLAENETQSGGGKEISQEMVRQVADRVYQMLLLETAVENERRRATTKGGNRSKRGR